MTDKLKCNTCHEVKDPSEFYKSHTKSRGYTGKCKKCTVKYNRERTTKIAQERYLGIRPKVDPAKKEKKCSTCEQVKPVSEFSRKTNTDDGYNTYCHTCYRERKKRERRNTQ